MIPDIKFISAGHFASQEEWTHPTVSVASFEFIYMTEGVAHLYEGVEEIILKAGDVLLFSPNVIHGGAEPSSERVSFLWAHVEAENEESARFLRSLPRVMRSVEDSLMPSEMRRLLHRASSDFYTDGERTLCAKMLVCEYSVLATERERYGAENGLVNRVREWVRINSDTKLTVADVAREFGYNEDYVTRLFKKKTRISLKNYIDEGRMNLLRTALSTTDTPLKEIARKMGFDDCKSFLKFFSYHEGVTPTEFRESCRNTHRNKK